MIVTLTNNGYTLEVTVTEQVDALKNTSDVSVGVRVKSAYKKGILYLSGAIKLDGTALVTMNSAVSTHNVPITALNTWYNVVRSSSSYTDSPWTMAGIAHNTDGSKSLKLELEIRGYDAGGYRSFTVSDSRTLVLTHIPRASTIGATDANIGSVSNIAVSRKSVAYTHTIAYSFGTLSGYIGEGGALSQTAVQLTDTAIAFSVPLSFYAQIPSAKKGTCTLTCRTYSGATQVGDAQTAQFTVTAAKDLCAPTVSGTVVDTNEATIALTGDANTLVRYVSDALCTITATAKNSASIATKTIGGETVTGTTRTISGIAQASVAFGCTDSRGYTASATVQKPLVPYIHLTANVTAKRTDPTSGNAVLTLSGKYYPGTFGQVSNKLTIQYRVNGGAAVTLEAAIDGDSYQAEAALSGLNYQNAHNIAVTVTDCLEKVEKTVTVGKGIPVFDWGEEDFQFHVPVYVNGVPAARQIDVLWENPSWTSSFPSQTVALPAEAYYDGFIVAFCYNTGAGYTTTVFVNNYFIRNGRNLMGSFLPGKVNPQGVTLADSHRYATFPIGANVYENGRYQASEITFGSGYSGETVDDTKCIPIYVYGIKW